MVSKSTMIIALFVALTFSLGLPVFAEENPSHPATSETHMTTGEAETTKEATPKVKKTKRKKRMAKKSKKAHTQPKVSGDAS